MEDVIPSMVDGLTESERMLLFTAINMSGESWSGEIKVAQLAKDTYSMFRPKQKYRLPYRMAVIVHMAHDFAGSNNINLFIPMGDFGSRYLGKVPNVSHGTNLVIKVNPVVRRLFTEADDEVALNQLGGCAGCGRLPMWFLPSIPLSLVNGVDCTVFGYRSYVPKYRPKDIIANLRCLLKKEDMRPMIPWFKGFKGCVEACGYDDTKFVITGAVGNIDNETKTVEVTELPVGIQTQDYVNLLKEGSIPNKGYVDCSDYSNQSLCLKVSLLDEDCKLDIKHLVERLKLTRIISIAEMYLIDDKGMARKYDSPLEVIHEFYHYRFPFFEHKKKVLLDDYSKQLEDLDNRVHESGIVAKQCINKLKLMKGKLPPDLKDFFDEYVDKKIGKVNQAITSVEFVDEAVDNLGALLDKIVSFENSEGPKRMKVQEHSKNGDSICSLETAVEWIRTLGSALQTLRLQTDKPSLRQKLDDLKQANISSLWLDDLDRLEEYLAEPDYLAVAAEKGMEAATYQSGEGSTSLGKKRRSHSLDHDISERRIAYNTRHRCRQKSQSGGAMDSSG